MAVKDFFWFKKEDYEERIRDRSKYSDERLHKERSHNARQQFSGCWSIGNGLLCCIATGGLTTGIVLYDVRNRSVSNRKLKLLEKEAERRGMTKYDQGKRDFWVSFLSNSVHCFTGCKVDSCVSCMMTDAPTYIEDAVQRTVDRSEAAAQEKEQLISAKTTDNPSKEFDKDYVQVNNQVQGQARITQASKSHVSEPNASEKGAPIVRNASVPSVQEQPNMQGQGRTCNASESPVSGSPHSSEAGRRGMKKGHKRKRDLCISLLSNSVGFCRDMLPEGLVPNVQDVAQMTDVKPTDLAGPEAEKPSTAVGGQDGIALREQNQVSELYALPLQKEAERRGTKKRTKRKRGFWISCILKSLGFCIASDSCLADMLPGEPIPSVEDVDQMTDVKPLEAGEEARTPITARMTENPSEVEAEAVKLNTRVGGQETIAVCEENQLRALEKEAGTRCMKKRDKSKRRLWISRIYNSVGFCIGSDSCLADMLPGEAVLSGDDVVQMTDTKASDARAQAGKPTTVHITDKPSKARTRSKKLNARVKKQERTTLREENEVSETSTLAKGAGRRGRKKREKRLRDFWVPCISTSVGFCVGPDSCLIDLLPGALVSNVKDAYAGEDVLQKTDDNSSGAEAQSRNPITVQSTDKLLEADVQAREPIRVEMKTDNLLETGTQLEIPSTRVEGQEHGLEHGFQEGHVSEPYSAGFPVSDVERPSPVPGSLLSCEGVEPAEYSIVVASAMEAETKLL